MSCPDEKALKLFIVGRLTPQQVEELEKHLETCPACSERLAKLEAGANIPILDDIRAAHLSGSGTGTLGDNSTTSPDIPRSIGHHNILGVLGAGGMGTVYLAENPHLGRKVAIKVIKPTRRFHQSSIDRFSREMKAVGKLQHRNIVQALDGGVIDGQPYLVMEYLEGCDLSNYVKEHGRLSVKQACNIIRQAATGLDYAHRLGYVHRDVKPSNLWITPDGTVKILDFGLVGLLESETTELSSEALQQGTVEGVILGSPDYISPEQIIDSKNADNRSDIYSLGCTFFYLLTGRPPFDKTTHPTLDNKLEGHANESLPLLRTFRNDVPVSVENVLRKMVAKRPVGRYQLASDILFSSSETIPHSTNILRWSIPFLTIGLILLSILFFRFITPTSNDLPTQDIRPTQQTVSTDHVSTPDVQPEKASDTSLSSHSSFNDNTTQGIPLTQQTVLTDSLSTPDIQPEKVSETSISNHPSFEDIKPKPSVPMPSDDEKSVIGEFPRLHPDNPDWEIVQILNVGNGFFNSAYFASGETIIEADENGTVRLWSVPTGKVLREYGTKQSAMTSFALASDQSMFASGHKNGTVELWELNADQPFHSYRKSDGAIRSLCFSNNSEKLFSLSNELDLLDIESKRSEFTKSMIKKGMEFYPCGSCFGPRNDVVFFTIHNSVGVYNILEKKTKGFDQSISNKPPLASLKIGSSMAIPSGETRIWMTLGMRRRDFRSVFSFAFASDATQAAINQATGEVTCVAFFPNQWLLTGGKDTPVNIWSFSDIDAYSFRESRSLVQSFPLDDPKDAVIALDCSPDGKRFLIRTKDNPQIIVWEHTEVNSQNGTNE